MKIIMQKRGDALVPLDDEEQEQFENVPSNKPVYCVVRSHRNLLHHKKFFKMIRTLCENDPRELQEPAMLHQIKLACCWYDVVEAPITGKPVPMVWSISFEAMEQAEFNKRYNEAIAAAIQHIIPRMGLSPERERALTNLINGF